LTQDQPRLTFAAPEVTTNTKVSPTVEDPPATENTTVRGGDCGGRGRADRGSRGVTGARGGTRGRGGKAGKGGRGGMLQGATGNKDDDHHNRATDAISVRRSGRKAQPSEKILYEADAAQEKDDKDTIQRARQWRRTEEKKLIAAFPY
jgi:hypothetical protein